MSSIPSSRSQKISNENAVFGSHEAGRIELADERNVDLNCRLASIPLSLKAFPVVRKLDANVLWYAAPTFLKSVDETVGIAVLVLTKVKAPLSVER
jgi:hypothetical protein